MKLGGDKRAKEIRVMPRCQVLARKWVVERATKMMIPGFEGKSSVWFYTRSVQESPSGDVYTWLCAVHSLIHRLINRYLLITDYGPEAVPGAGGIAENRR